MSSSVQVSAMLLLAGLPQPGLGLWNAFDGAPGVALLSDRRHPLYSTPLRDAAVSASLATPVLQTRTMEYLRHCDAGDASPAEQSAEGEGEGEPAAEGDGQEEGGTAPNSRCCSPVPLRGGYVGPGARIGVDLPRVALASVSRLRHELRYELWHGSPTEVWSSMAAVTAAWLVWARGVLWIAWQRVLWLCLGLELRAVRVQEPTPRGIATAVSRAICVPGPVVRVGNAADGPVHEVLHGIKAAGCALADVEVDYLAAVRYSLLQLATLAFGRIAPEAGGGAFSDSDSDSEDSTLVFGGMASAPATEGSGAQGVTQKVKHVFLSTADASTDRTRRRAQDTPDCEDSSAAEAAVESSVWGDSSLSSCTLGSRVKVPIHLRAPHARTASVVGSWNNWGQRYDLARMADSRGPQSDGDFLGLLALPPGRYEFKFVIDGVWQTKEGWPVQHDTHGNLNNILCVDAPGVDASAAPTSCGGSPPSRRHAGRGVMTERSPSGLRRQDLGRSDSYECLDGGGASEDEPNQGRSGLRQLLWGWASAARQPPQTKMEGQSHSVLARPPTPYPYKRRSAQPPRTRDLPGHKSRDPFCRAVDTSPTDSPSF